MALQEPHPHEQFYMRQYHALRIASGTVCLDSVVRTPGYAPGMWLSAKIHEFFVRASTPSPPEFEIRNLMNTARFLQNSLWSDERLGHFAGKVGFHDIVVEALTEWLIVDDGEPAKLAVIAVLSRGEVLLAHETEWILADDYWADRAILRAATDGGCTNS